MTSTNYSGNWTKEALCKGDGFIIEGTIQSQKIHSVFLQGKTNIHETQLPTRFLAIVVEIDSVVKRNWNKDGYEIPPKMIRSNAISKGHLNRYDRVQSALVDKLDVNQLAQLIANGKALPANFHDEVLPNLHPNKVGIFEFFLSTDKFNHKDVKAGDEVRIKTIGNSPFVETYSKMDASQISNLAGDKDLGTSWTKNINKFKDSNENETQPETLEDDDEDWN